MKPQLTIAVLTYNGSRLLPECLASIEQQSFPCAVEKLVVENGTMESLQKIPQGWRRFYTYPNVGHIAGQNLCFEQATTPYVLFVSNDVRFAPNSFTPRWYQAVKLFRGQAMPIIRNVDGTIQVAGTRLQWPGIGLNQVTMDRLDYIPSICYGMPVTLWQSLGGFDERYPGAYEDVDLGVRLGSRSLGRWAEMSVKHLGNATLQYRTPTPFRESRRFFIRKHYRGLDRWSRLVACLAMELSRPVPPETV